LSTPFTLLRDIKGSQQTGLFPGGPVKLYGPMLGLEPDVDQRPERLEDRRGATTVIVCTWSVEEGEPKVHRVEVSADDSDWLRGVALARG
jgi:hypothetical protein